MEHFAHVFAATGPLDAVCYCEPPGARGGSGLPWYMSLLNLIGIVKVRRAEAQVFLGLRQGNLVYAAFDDDGHANTAVIPFGNVGGAQVAPKNEWSHHVSFVVDGKTHSYVTCAYLFGAPDGTPPEAVEHVKQMERTIIGAIATRR